MSEEKVLLRFHGHGCMQLTKGGISLIVDPFLAPNNPAARDTAADIKCKYVLVSHCHPDHMADAPEIVKNNRAMLIGTFEVAHEVAKLCEGAEVDTPGLGAKKAYEFGYIRVTPAIHGSGVAGGFPCGFVVNFYGKTVYFACDTGLFGDMKLLGQMESIDYAALPIGGYYTMGPDDAALAVEFLNPKAVIPVHYNTWPIIEQDPSAFKSQVEGRYGKPVRVMAPGEEITL